MPKGRPASKSREDLGERIARARQTAKLTQRQLADKLTDKLTELAEKKVVVTQRMVAYWEREAVSLRADQLDALADALGVTTDVLVGRQPLDSHNLDRVLFNRVAKLPEEEREKIVQVVRVMVSQAKAA